MSYRIAGIDVHKKMLAVVVADVEVQGEYQFEQRQFGSNPEHLRLLAEWLIELGLRASIAEALGVGLVVAVITYFSLVIGELVPKQIALRSPEPIAAIVARPMRVMSILRGRDTEPLGHPGALRGHFCALHGFLTLGSRQVRASLRDCRGERHDQSVGVPLTRVATDLRHQPHR